MALVVSWAPRRPPAPGGRGPWPGPPRRASDRARTPAWRRRRPKLPSPRNASPPGSRPPAVAAPGGRDPQAGLAGRADPRRSSGRAGASARAAGRKRPTRPDLARSHHAARRLCACPWLRVPVTSHHRRLGLYDLCSYRGQHDGAGRPAGSRPRAPAAEFFTTRRRRSAAIPAQQPRCYLDRLRAGRSGPEAHRLLIKCASRRGSVRVST
jgi:hypothetical protein